MKRLLALSSLALASALVLLAPAATHAGQATNTLTVSAVVIPTCTIDAATLAFGDFGNYDATANLDASTTITVRCTEGASFWVGMGLGSNPSGTQRRMSDGAGGFLNYDLYRAMGPPAVAWDNADPITRIDATTAGYVAYTSTLFGRIPLSQYVPAGSYGDSVQMTVNF